VVRAGLLFFKEAHLVSLPEWSHDGIGLLCFAGSGWGILALATRLVSSPNSEAVLVQWASVRSRVMLAAACLLAGVAPLFPHEAPARSSPPFAWPKTFEGESLVLVQPSAAEARFEASFPGAVAQFTAGPRRLILRQVTTGTRLLHSSADCFRGLGYDVEPAPAVRDANGDTWSAFTAARPGHTLHVRERIVECATARSWSDVSAWYWATLLHPAAGPWLATTVIEEEGAFRDARAGVGLAPHSRPDDHRALAPAAPPDERRSLPHGRLRAFARV
jgi:hypothetical protein